MVLGAALSACGLPTGKAAPQPPPSPTPQPSPGAAAEPRYLQAGDMAPDFTLPGVDGKLVSLSQYRGKENVLLFFHMGTG